MAKLADFLKLIADKTGIDQNDKSFIDLMSANVTVPDDLFSKFETGVNSLMNEEAAKNNAKLASHFKAQALLPADSEIQSILESLGLEDADKQEFATEKSTYKKIGKLVEKVKALEAKKSGATTSADKKALTDEIAKLNGTINDVKSQYEAKLKAAEDNANNAILQYAQEALLNGKPYADTIPEAIRVTSALQLVNKELSAKGAKAVRGADGSIKLVQSANPDLEYLENHKAVGYGEFSDRVLSTHAMLKVSDPAGKKPGTTTHTKLPSGEEPKNVAVVSANEQHLAALEKGLGG